MRIIVFLLIFFSVHSLADPLPVPELHHQVTDLTHTLTGEQTKLLTQQVRGMPGQVAVLVVPTSGEETIEQYTTRVFDAWKLGDGKLDNGILLLVAWQDHTVRIEVGYGLEGTLTDAQAGQIIRRNIIPAFKNGDLMAGLQQGIAAVGTTLNNGEPLPTSVDKPKPFNGGWALLIWAVVLLLITIKSSFKTLGLICLIAVILTLTLLISGHATGWGKLIALLSFATPFILLFILLLTPTPAGKAFRKIARESNAAAKRERNFSSQTSYRPSKHDNSHSGSSSNNDFHGGGGSSGGGGASGRW